MYAYQSMKSNADFAKDQNVLNGIIAVYLRICTDLIAAVSSTMLLHFQLTPLIC